MEEILTCYGDCVPAVNSRTGEILTASNGKSQARRILERREGPPPFEGALCRHLCKNDSQAHKRENGFVCTLHTTWGTKSENEMDKSPETRARSASAGGRISKGGRIGGKAAKLSPLNAINMQVTCPHCGKTGQKFVMSRWHFDNCKFKLAVS